VALLTVWNFVYFVKWFLGLVRRCLFALNDSFVDMSTYIHVLCVQYIHQLPAARVSQYHAISLCW